MTQEDIAQTGVLRIFVYGTLKQGFCNHDRFCRGALSIEKATAAGRLYELPSGIPIIEVPESDIIATGSGDVTTDLHTQDHTVLQKSTHSSRCMQPKVQGELMILDDPIQRLQAIDRLEGFVPGSSCLYQRVLLPVHRHDGTIASAWCYVLGLKSVRLRAIHRSEW